METNETEMLRNEINRQNQLIDVLLTANQQLQRQVSELSGALSSLSITQTDMPSGNFPASITSSKVLSGNTDLQVSNSNVLSGNSYAQISSSYLPLGNPATDITRWQVPPGNIEIQNSKFKITVGTYSFLVSGVKLKPGKNGLPVSLFHLALRDMMKNGSQSCIYITAVILQQLHGEPATSLRQLQQLTGMSYSGIAKRIMTMKKNGFIVAHIAPKRFVLTEKAAQLFAAL